MNHRSWPSLLHGHGRRTDCVEVAGIQEKSYSPTTAYWMEQSGIGDLTRSLPTQPESPT